MLVSASTSQALPQLTALTSLDLSDNDLGDARAEGLFKALSPLHFNEKSSPGAGVGRSPPPLRELRLNRTFIMDCGAAALSDLLPYLTDLQSLELQDSFPQVIRLHNDIPFCVMISMIHVPLSQALASTIILY